MFPFDDVIMKYVTFIVIKLFFCPRSTQQNSSREPEQMDKLEVLWLPP